MLPGSPVAIPTGFADSTEIGCQAQCDKPAIVQVIHVRRGSQRTKILYQRLGPQTLFHAGTKCSRNQGGTNFSFSEIRGMFTKLDPFILNTLSLPFINSKGVQGPSLLGLCCFLRLEFEFLNPSCPINVHLTMSPLSSSNFTPSKVQNETQDNEVINKGLFSFIFSSYKSTICWLIVENTERTGEKNILYTPIFQRQSQLSSQYNSSQSSLKSKLCFKIEI